MSESVLEHLGWVPTPWGAELRPPPDPKGQVYYLASLTRGQMEELDALPLEDLPKVMLCPEMVRGRYDYVIGGWYTLNVVPYLAARLELGI